VSIWDFEAVPPQKERKHYTRNKHPAKMRPSLASAILQIYGESTVLDPMSGIGTTLVEAMLLGLDSKGIELEQDFVRQANANIQKIKKEFKSSKNIGKSSCILGDARRMKFKDNSFNSILFSPPYWITLGKGTKKKSSSKSFLEKHKGLPEPYSPNPENIGNKTHYIDYLDEMLKVYRECFRVLRLGKFMAIIIKDIRRRNLTIPLGADTIKLCERAGFRLFDILVNRLYFLSYWQVLLAIRDKDKGIPHPLRTHEYVLVFKKPER
jgi:DNA modification methylase